MANKKIAKRIKRKMHIRKSLSGTADRPRVYVYRTNKFVYVGVADDVAGKVLMSKKVGKGIESVKKVGEEIGKNMLKGKVESAVFDRSGYKYHGNVKAVADGLREAGIKV